MRFRKIFLIYFLTLFIIDFVQAQNKSKYEGEYEFLKGEKGAAIFNYTVNENGQRFIDGDFIYTFKTTDSIDKTFYLRRIEGKYSRNLKTGAWAYNATESKTPVSESKNAKASAIQNGKIQEVQAFYIENIPHGDYKHTITQLTNGDAKPIFSSENLTLRLGSITNKFSLKITDANGTYPIEGYANNIGLMDSTWTIHYYQNSNLIKEERLYKNGILLNISKYNATSKKLLEEFSYKPAIKKLENLDNQEEFDISTYNFGLLFNDGYHPEDPALKIQEAGNRTLDSLLKELFFYDQNYYLKEGEFDKLPIKTKRFQYEISEEDEEIIEEITPIHTKLISKISKALADKQLNEYKDVRDSLSFTYNYLSSLKKNLEEYTDFMVLLDNGHLKYIDVNNYKINGKLLLNPSELISYELRNNRFEKKVDYSPAIKEEVSFSKNFKAYLLYKEKLVEKLMAYAKAEFVKIEYEKKVQAVQGNMQTLKHEVDSIYNNYNPEVITNNDIVKRIQVKFLEEGYKKRLHEYNSKEEYAVKNYLGEKTINFLFEIKNVFNPLKEIYVQNDTLKKLYRVGIKKPIKKRLYKASSILYDHYIYNLLNENDHEKIKDHIVKLDKLFVRMKELKDQDTKKLEKELKKKVAPAEIEVLLGL